MDKYDKASTDSAYFNTIAVDNTFIKDWQIWYESPNKDKRLYVKLKDKGSGFEVIALEFASCSVGYKGSWWEDDRLAVVIIFQASAYFDGVRHITWYPLDDGYSNYPCLADTTDMLKLVCNLEESHCRES